MQADTADRDERQPGHGSGRVNQPRHEPVPASHRAEADQGAVISHEGHAAGQAPEPAVHGDAVRDMMGAPGPQGDVPDAPGTQVATADEDKENGPRAGYVANAVPGKPDGEVDTRGS